MAYAGAQFVWIDAYAMGPHRGAVRGRVLSPGTTFTSYVFHLIARYAFIKITKRFEHFEEIVFIGSNVE
jgi:hypothetical protein